VQKKIRLKSKRRKIPKRVIFLWSIVFVLITTVFLIDIVGKKINPIFLNYAQIETNKIATMIVKDAINERVINKINLDDLFIISKTETGEIQTVDFNSVIVNEVLSASTLAIQEKIIALEKGNTSIIEELSKTTSAMSLSKLKNKIVCEIPFGILTNNTLLSNLGPKVPVRISFSGDVIANINTKIDSYGINNALVTISVKVELKEQVIMPLLTNKGVIAIDIPIAIKMVQGKVPTYYQNGIDKNSSIFSLPVQ